MHTDQLESVLEELYGRLNRREFVHPDPLEFLYRYPYVADREVAALVASSLAYGNVRQILRSVSSVLERMPVPHRFLSRSTRDSLLMTFAGFKHRFTTGAELGLMLYGAKLAIERFGSLAACFNAGLSPDHQTIVPALAAFVRELAQVFNGKPRSLLPSPDAGSACKRLNLFLRWMVRKDDVDPGGWDNVDPALLVVPLDVHMHRICMRLGLTTRKQANLKAAHEVTRAFRSIAPHDPVRYDFALTRLGIRDDMDPRAFLDRCSRRRK
ncbi:MAG: TIGR02757 family protein [Thermodesulfobacteriota bacterium]